MPQITGRPAHRRVHPVVVRDRRGAGLRLSLQTACARVALGRTVGELRKPLVTGLIPGQRDLLPCLSIRSRSMFRSWSENSNSAGSVRSMKSMSTRAK